MLSNLTLLGWGVRQWGAFFGLLVGGYLAARLVTWAAGALVRRRTTGGAKRLAQFLEGPVMVLVWLVILRTGASQLIRPSEELRPLFSAGTLVWLAMAWAGVRLVVLVFGWWIDYFKSRSQTGAALVLKSVRTIVSLTVVLGAVLSWLGNLGFDIGAVLAGLGVTGLATALAAQDTLRSFIGSLMILLDRPYQVGERVVVKGHDGIVEEIGLRSTQIRELSGHLTTIPNADMAAAIGGTWTARRRDPSPLAHGQKPSLRMTNWPRENCFLSLVTGARAGRFSGRGQPCATRPCAQPSGAQRVDAASPLWRCLPRAGRIPASVG